MSRFVMGALPATVIAPKGSYSCLATASQLYDNILTYLPSRFWRKANNVQGLFAFLPSFVATIKFTTIEIYTCLSLVSILY